MGAGRALGAGPGRGACGGSGAARSVPARSEPRAVLRSPRQRHLAGLWLAAGSSGSSSSSREPSSRPRPRRVAQDEEKP